MIQYTIQVITHKDVPSWVSLINFNRVSRFKWELPISLNIDFTNTHEILPYHIVSLACLIEEYFLEGVNVRFTLTENYAVIYLRQLDFFNFWTPGFNRKEYRICADGTSYCLWQIHQEMFHSYVDHAHEYYKRQFFRGKDISPFNRSLVELFYNVVDHSESTVSGYVFTQYFPNKKYLIISLCDFGLGIPTTVNNYFLKHNKPMVGSLDAIEWAFKKGNSVRSKENNGGLGLDIISSITKSLNGTLVIISNDAHIMQQPDGSIVKKELPKAFLGTQVVVSLNTQYLNPLEDDHNIFH
ncbi:MAG: hypothetical protein V4547_03265 [Bacteroidota bacterium]